MPKSLIHLFFVLLVLFVLNGSLSHYTDGRRRDESCGLDKSSIPVVYEGVAKVETYPWMGYLFYHTNTKRYITSIVLVTRQMALGTALDIDKLPKDDFRARARAVFGCNCSGPSVPIRDYNYHPDYETNSYSALAMVQLETDNSPVVLHPICPPPSYFLEPQIYAMALSDTCKKPNVKLYEMKYVNADECKVYYRKFGLGFGVHGPGCGAPARFLDYGAFHRWVRRNIDDIGKPAISRVGPNVVVVRRSLSNLQRYGPCDEEETKYEIYTDHTEITTPQPLEKLRIVRYNVSLYAGVDYSCVVFRVDNFIKRDKEPMLHLRRWCAGAINTCKDFQYIEIEFYVEISFSHSIIYDMKAYGRVAKAIDVNRAMKYINRKSVKPEIYSFPALWIYMWRYDKYKSLTNRHYPKDLNLTNYYARFRWMNLRSPKSGHQKWMLKQISPRVPRFDRMHIELPVDDYINSHPASLHYLHGWDRRDLRQREIIAKLKRARRPKRHRDSIDEL